LPIADLADKSMGGGGQNGIRKSSIGERTQVPPSDASGTATSR
jgi:hypothetical protein